MATSSNSVNIPKLSDMALVPAPGERGGDAVMLEAEDEAILVPTTPHARKGEKKASALKAPALGVAKAGVAKAGAAKPRKKKSSESEGRLELPLVPAMPAAGSSQVAKAMHEYFEAPWDLPKFHANPQALITSDEFMGSMIADTLKFTTGRNLDWLKVHDGVTAPLSRYFARNADLVCARVPLRTRTYQLTFGQVATVYYIAFGTPVTLTFGYEVDLGVLKAAGHGAIAEKLERENRFTHMLEPGRSGLRIACMPTGTGKTVVTTAALLTSLLTGKGEKQAEKMFLAAARDPHTGARPVTSTDAPSKMIAPLVIVFCPGALENNWANAARELQPEVARMHAAQQFWAPEVRVWQGSKSKEARSIKSVYLDGIPTVWVLPANSESLKVLYEDYDVGFRGFALDEGATLSTRYTGKLSPVCGPTVVAQATLATLHNPEGTSYLDRKGNLLVRWLSKESLLPDEKLAKGLGSKYVKENFQLFTKCLRQGSADGLVVLPRVLVMACGVGASQLMPAGLKKFRLTPCEKTIHETMAYACLNPPPLDGLLKSWIVTTVKSICSRACRGFKKPAVEPDFLPQDFAFVETRGEEVSVDFRALNKAGNDKVGKVLKGLESLLPNVKDKDGARDFIKDRYADFDRAFADKFEPFSRCPCGTKAEGAEACAGGKILFSGDKKTCEACSAVYEPQADFSLENLEPGSRTLVNASALSLFARVFEKAVANHKHVVVYSGKTSKEFFERYDCETLMMTEGDGAGAMKIVKGPNKHKKAAMVARFNRPRLRGEKPIVLVLGQSELVGTDLQHVDVIISFGTLREDERKQLAGRGLRMTTSSVKDKHVHMYMM